MIVHTPNLKIAMVGVVPPPVHGQSLATQALFNADLSPIERETIEIRSSKEIDEVGKLSFSKILGLPEIIWRILVVRFRSGARVLYYTAGSASMVPFARDVIILGIVRPFFRKVLIHYHSGGLPEYLSASSIRRFLGCWIYGRGAWSLSLSRFTAVPGLDFGAEKEIEIPNGVDVPADFRIPESRFAERKQLRLTYIGNLYEDKGIFDLLAAAKLAAEESPVPLSLTFAGKWADEHTRQRFCKELEILPERLSVGEPAARYGNDKWKLLEQSDLFLFPTYYRNENLPLVLIEAMAASLPVVATRWRGIPSLVDDGITGTLVAPHDVTSLSHAIIHLAHNPDLRMQMGKRGKRKYEEKFTMATHLQTMKKVIMEACQSAQFPASQ